MKAKVTTSLLIAGALIAMPMASYADSTTMSGKKETAKEHVSDAWITTKIKAEFAKDKVVSATRIHVDTDNGVVKLSGNAKSQSEVDHAMSLAKNTKGVTDVKNDIQVGATGATQGSGATGSATSDSAKR